MFYCIVSPPPPPLKTRPLNVFHLFEYCCVRYLYGTHAPLLHTSKPSVVRTNLQIIITRPTVCPRGWRYRIIIIFIIWDRSISRRAPEFSLLSFSFFSLAHSTLMCVHVVLFYLFLSLSFICEYVCVRARLNCGRSGSLFSFVRTVTRTRGAPMFGPSSS